jgi:hypothetical protein
MILADLSDSFQANVAACDGPLVVLLEHQRADEANDGVIVGKKPDNIRTPLDLFVQRLEWPRASCRISEAHETSQVSVSGSGPSAGVPVQWRRIAHGLSVTR